MKVARWGQALDTGFVGHSMFVDYRLDTHPVLPGLRPIHPNR